LQAETSALASASAIVCPAALASMNLTGIVEPALKLDPAIGLRKPRKLYLTR